MMEQDETPAPFDPCGSMPDRGITVLEASAGTGKTFTIAALMTRLVADGIPIDKILAVTFTRMATAELRDRVRARLVLAEERLGRFVDADEAPPEDDRVVCLLTKGSGKEVNERRTRLADALAVFDAATITTTHGFCQLVLDGLGVSGRVGVGAALIEDASDTITETVDDLFAGRVLRAGPPPFDRQVAHRIARAAVDNPATPLEPEAGDSTPGRQRRLAESARKEVARRLLDQNLLTYDDLLVRLRDTLIAPERGEAACQLLRSRYQVVLVDEFQDTDPVQWEVVRRAFGDGQTTLVLIGDPKQAIYAFRGADVYAYLEAAGVASCRFTLTENWRSDQALLAAYDALLDPLHVGHPDIPYRHVAATPAHRHPGLQGAPATTPLRFRVLHVEDRLGVRLTSKGLAQKDAALEWVARDLAADITGVLASEAQLVGVSAVGSERPRPRAVSPGDIAVLVRTNRQAGVVQSALRAVGVPAVVGSTDSVFGSMSARHWLRLLEALEQPASRTRAVAVALTPFVGMTADDVATADEALWEDLHARLHHWAEVLRRLGVAALARAVLVAEGLPGRILVEVTGERDLTDLGHVAQLLHEEGSAAQLGPPALRAWLARRIEGFDSETADAEDRSRRLDSDAEAVQVLTVHRAKGLEFPIVYCPYLWDAAQMARRDQPVVFHDALHANRRTLDVGSADAPASYCKHFDEAHDEQRGEDLRLLYVALTRARHQAVVWWVRAKDSEHSPLGRLLMFRDANGNVAPSGRFSPKDAAVHHRLEELAERAPGHISVERCCALRDARWEEPPRSADQLLAARFERRLDLSWRRTSYTGITAFDYHGAVVGSEPEDPGLTDEPPTSRGSGFGPTANGAGESLSPRPHYGAGVPGDEARLRAVPSLLAGTPAGAEVGTFVHGVLERVDFSADDLTAEVTAAIAAERARRSIGVGDTGTLAAGLVAAISTPLGPLASGRRLHDVGRGDRVDELGFELPLAGGDRPAGEIIMGDVARLFAAHTEPGGTLDGYAARLASPALASHLRGYLSGSLDLVVRFDDDEGRARFLVVDYKTNWLAPEGEALSAWHYRPAALDIEMQQAHYPLQAMLYLVALHRYLRWRLAGYDPATNLAGVLYLFVRGMSGLDTPVVDGGPCGVFAWPAPTRLVTGLSDLLDTGSLAR
jgi:exodeoxyribonuclease V beta subunit